MSNLNAAGAASQPVNYHIPSELQSLHATIAELEGSVIFNAREITDHLRPKPVRESDKVPPSPTAIDTGSKVPPLVDALTVLARRLGRVVDALNEEYSFQQEVLGITHGQIPGGTPKPNR